MPDLSHFLTHKFASRLVPTKEGFLPLKETSLQENFVGQRALAHANIRRQPGSYRQAVKRDQALKNSLSKRSTTSGTSTSGI